MKGQRRDDAAFSFVTGFFRSVRALFLAKRVADRSADTKYVIGVETGIIYDVVEVSFGAHKVVSENPVADTEAGVKQELVAVEVGGAPRGKVAGAIYVVEKKSLSADSCHDLRVGSVGQVRSEYAVEVIKNGPIFLVAVVKMFFIGVGELSAVAEAVGENMDDAEAGIESALFRRGNVALGSADVLGG